MPSYSNFVRESRRSASWLSLGSITAARVMARAGFDWLTVDMEHSLVGIETATHMFASIAEAGWTSPCGCRPSHDYFKRVLDNGAMGVVVPMVNSRAEAEAAVSACRYPPRGTLRRWDGPRAEFRNNTGRLLRACRS